MINNNTINKRPTPPSKFHQMQVSTEVIDRLARLKRKGKFRTYDALLRHDYGLNSIENNKQQPLSPKLAREHKTLNEECPHCHKLIMTAAIQSAKNLGETTFTCYFCNAPIDISNWTM